MAKQPKQLDGLFHDGLKTAYFAGKKILGALPRLAKATRNEELIAAFVKHQGETANQVSRLEEVFVLIGKKPQAQNSAAILSIIEEGEAVAKEYKGSPALDAVLVATAQAIEHHELARYGALRSWAQELGMLEAVRLIDRTLDEKDDTADALFDLAVTVVKRTAPQDAAA